MRVINNEKVKKDLTFHNCHARETDSQDNCRANRLIAISTVARAAEARTVAAGFFPSSTKRRLRPNHEMVRSTTERRGSKTRLSRRRCACQSRRATRQTSRPPRQPAARGVRRPPHGFGPRKAGADFIEHERGSSLARRRGDYAAPSAFRIIFRRIGDRESRNQPGRNNLLGQAFRPKNIAREL